MKSIFGFLFAALAVILFANTCEALGTLTVQKANQPVQSYAKVKIVYANKALHITSADGKGTLIINKAACSYVGDLQVCLPYGAALEQAGTTSPINITSGTAYANLTSETQTLPASSTRIPPNGIIMSLTTKIGTIINLTGTLDKIDKGSK